MDTRFHGHGVAFMRCAGENSTPPQEDPISLACGLAGFNLALPIDNSAEFINMLVAKTGQQFGGFIRTTA